MQKDVNIQICHLCAVTVNRLFLVAVSDFEQVGSQELDRILRSGKEP